MIREATFKDKDEFIHMWKEYLHEFSPRMQGVSDTPEALGWYLGLFKAYTEGSLFGGCLFWYPEESKVLGGLVLAGEPHNNILEDSCAPQPEHGKVAVVWGMYVQPIHRSIGVSIEMLTYGMKRAPELGFDTAMTETPYNLHTIRRTEEIYGVLPDTVRYFYPLHKEDT